MSRNNSGATDEGGWSRRTLLRRAGAATAGGLALGTALTGTAAARPGRCPQPCEHWAVAPWPDTIEDPFELGGRELSIAEWKEFLLADPGDDRTHELAKQLLATIINMHYRWPDDPECTDKAIEALDGKTITDVRGDAFEWLNWSTFDEGVPHEHWAVHTHWYYTDGEPIRDALEKFNRNEFGELDCNCGHELTALQRGPHRGQSRSRDSQRGGMRLSPQ